MPTWIFLSLTIYRDLFVKANKILQSPSSVVNAPGFEGLYIRHLLEEENTGILFSTFNYSNWGELSFNICKFFLSSLNTLPPLLTLPLAAFPPCTLLYEVEMEWSEIRSTLTYLLQRWIETTSYNGGALHKL